MLKNLSKEKLLQETYQLNARNQHLLDCLESKDVALVSYENSMEELMHSWLYRIFFRFIPSFKKQIQSHKKTTNTINKIKMTEEQILTSLEKINLYERKELSYHHYKSFIEGYVKIKRCTTCGSSNTKFHQDFQTRVFNEMKKNFRHLLPPLVFKSARYASSSLSKDMPFYSYEYLQKTVALMTKYKKTLELKGYNQQLQYIQEDIDTLKHFIVARLDFTIDKFEGELSFDEAGNMVFIDNGEVENEVNEQLVKYTQNSDTTSLQNEKCTQNSDSLDIDWGALGISAEELNQRLALEKESAEVPTNLVESFAENIKQNELSQNTESSESSENTSFSEKKTTKKEKPYKKTGLQPDEAYQLKLSGMSVVEIGKKYDLTRGHVNKLINKFIDENGLGQD